MKKAILLLFLIIFSLGTSVYGQDLFQYFELIQPRHKVIAVKHVKHDTTLKKGTVLSVIPDPTKKWKNFALLKEELMLNEDLNITYQKVVTDTIVWHKNGGLRPGRAKLYPSEKKSRLMINWSVNQYGDTYYSDYSEYYIDLENRGKNQWFYFRGPVAGAVTIPFKYRGELKGKRDTVASTITSDLNASLSLGYTFGFSRYNYRKYGGINNTKFSLSLLAVAGPSVVTLNNGNTSLAKTPLPANESRGFGVLSLGGGVVIGIKNFSMGIFLGKDFAFGRDRNLWNYHNEWWTGYGFGYNIGLNAILQALKFGS